MSITEICRVLTANARRNIQLARNEDAKRPVGELALDIDFFSDAEREKPMEDYDFKAHGVHYRGHGARWCVVRVRWDGSQWKRVRRLSGPLNGSTAALDRLYELAKQTGLQRRLA